MLAALIIVSIVAAAGLAGCAALYVSRQAIQRDRIHLEQVNEQHLSKLDTQLSAPAVDPEKTDPKRTLDQKLQALYGAHVTAQGTLFVQPHRKDCQHVSMAGDFNEWSDVATPLQFNRKLNVWQTCLPLPPGRYRYRLVVDGKWSSDPHNRYVETNPFGELNNIVEVV